MAEPNPAEKSMDSSDPASSLRAVALLTLKRRKPTDITASSALPPRPTPTDTSLQLDYGQEDVNPSKKDAPMPPPAPIKTLSPDAEDGQTREEGEISDSEDPNSKLAKSLLERPIVIKAESPAPLLFDRSDSPHPSLSLALFPGEYYIDPDHVRPGLSMNQDQYDTAKEIVLDLLGWGVSPDYLVDCNLSREIIYYVFSELNLRFPSNLDINGLVPYNPAHVAKYSRPLMATPASEIPASSSSRPFHGHPSLPAKPPTTNSIPEPGLAPRPGLSSPPHHPLSTSADQPAAANGSLHDMERQRRQELLARKAVQASRKVKPPSDASSTASSSHAPADSMELQDQDAEMAPPVATEAVDDFLKTIGEKSVTPEAAIQPESTNTMDIDEIPGLGGSTASYRNTGPYTNGAGPDTDNQMPTHDDQVAVSPAESTLPTRSPLQNDPPPSSGDSASTTFGLEQASYEDQLSHNRSLQRRGAKRPTAADFVDFDTGSRNGHNGSLPPLKRKTASFASVSGHRKLVIDLSDSEGGEDYAMHDSIESDRWEGGSGYSSPAPGRYPAAAGGWATPPTGAVPPAALVEKEQEIRKMRELIAQREKSRMQRAISRTSGTTSTELPRREDEEASLNGTATVPYQNGTTVLATVDEPPLTDVNSDPPNMDSEEMRGQSGSGDEDSAMTLADNVPQDQLVSSQDGLQEPIVDVDSASSSSTQAQTPTTPVLQRHDESRQTSPRPEDNKYNFYEAYDSPFDLYPLLRCRAQQVLSDASTLAGPSAQASSSFSTSSQSSLSSLHSSSSSILSASLSISSLPSCSYTSTYSTGFPLPSLRPLILATCSALDPTKRICQYEVPGGGVCRDDGCEDLHLTRLGREGGTNVVEPSDANTAQYLYDLLPPAWLKQHGVTVAGLSTALQDARDKNSTLGFEERAARALLTFGPPPLP